MKLKGETELIKRENAEDKRLNELTVIIGDLARALYQVLFATAKELHMPKEVLDSGEMERINISLFLKHSNKKTGALRQYLLDAVESKGITLFDYNILVAAKRIRNNTFHDSLSSNRALLNSLQLSTIRKTSFDLARQVLLNNSTLFVTEGEDDEEED